MLPREIELGGFFMKRWRNFSVLVLSLILVLSLARAGVFASEASAGGGAPEIEWKRYLGGPGEDVFRVIRQTSDEGYLFTAEGGGPIGGDIREYKGTPEEYIDEDDGETKFWYARDYWVAKLDKRGDISWSKSYGGNAFDSAMNFVESSSGGYVITGFTKSGNEENDDMGGPNWGRNDAWVFKLDTDGNIKWTGAGPFGGVGFDTLTSVVQTPEEYAHAAGGVKHETYVLTGAMSSSVISVDNGTRQINMRENTNIISSDIWVHKLYEHGDSHMTAWSKAFIADDPKAYEMSRVIVNAQGGGYVIGATIQENGSDDGASEFWIFKLNEDGEKVWDKKIGKEEDGFYYFGSMKATSDGGYIVAGSKAEPEEEGGGHEHHDDSGGGHNHADTERNFDFWIVKLSGDGEVKWERTYGREGVIESAWDVIETDGGYIVAGEAEPENVGLANQEAGKTYSDRTDDFDALIVKFDTDGEAEWSMSLGGSSSDSASSIHRTSDGGYIIGGTTWSTDWEGLELEERGNGDGWAVKLAPEKREEEEEENDDDDDDVLTGSGGCSAGAAAGAAAALLTVVLLKRRRR